MIAVNDLGHGYPTFPQFQRMLIAYEADLFSQYREAVAEEKQAREVLLRSFHIEPSSKQADEFIAELKKPHTGQASCWCSGECRRAMRRQHE